MKKFVYAVKIGMTSHFTESGDIRGVTVVKVMDTTILSKAHQNDNDFDGVLVAAEVLNEKKCTSPMKGFFKGLDAEPMKHIKGIQLQDVENMDANSVLGISQFEEGESINVTAKSKGRGFSGTIVRHNFHRGNKTHGSKSYRAPGSIGGGTDPGRVMKGKKMAGQYGNTTITIKNLKILKIDNEKGLLFILGAIPGKMNTLVEIAR